MQEKRNKIIKIIIQAVLIIIVLGLIFVAVESILPGVIDTIAHGTGDDVKAYLDQFHDLKGYAVAFFLQFIQIVTIFLPSIPIQVAAGIVFGVWKGFLVCFLGYVSANAVIFILVRKLGSGLEKLLPSPSKAKEKHKKKQNAILSSNHPAFMVFLATTFPILPNGFIPYVAAKTKVSFVSFMAAISIGCVPTILTLCAVGKKLIGGDFLQAALYTLPLLLFFLIMFWQQKRITSLYEKIVDRINRKTETGQASDMDHVETLLEPEIENPFAKKETGRSVENGEDTE
ncbi:MAG: TVP38/TMEM64 family protein [Clostridia bacterium]|nr:TVP38/TMEM64 family protein [Clostridia bacterium]